MKRALITGVTGQDGSFLAEFLLDKDYVVYGMVRRSSTENKERIKHIINNPNFVLVYGDLSDSLSIINALKISNPSEIYNLAAQSHVQVSFEVPEYTGDIDALGTLRILESMRILGIQDKCRFYQASTSELFGKVVESPQSESTPFYPYSPYACAKAYSFYLVKNYREAYGFFAVNGILFNHESERRGESFVTRKITMSAVRISQGKQECLFLGNINSLRDWGYARDYVECMWLMLQNERPDDFVVSTGEQHSIKEFCELAFKFVGIELKWQGKELDEIGVDAKTGKTVIRISPDFFRPTDVNNLLGNPSKAVRELGWNPIKTTFKELVELMVEYDKKLLRCKI